MPTLADILGDWTDPDGAGFLLGVTLGLWENTWESFQREKHRFWTNDPLGSAIWELLRVLGREGRLESKGLADDDTEDEQYRAKSQDENAGGH